MWKKSEKNSLFGAAWAIWGCVISNPILGIMLTCVAVIYFILSLYHGFTEDE